MQRVDNTAYGLIMITYDLQAGDHDEDDVADSGDYDGYDIADAYGVNVFVIFVLLMAVMTIIVYLMMRMMVIIVLMMIGWCGHLRTDSGDGDEDDGFIVECVR